MEEVQIEKPAEIIQEKTSWYKSNPKVSMLGVFAALFILLLVGISFTLNTVKNNGTSKNTATTITNNFIANVAVIYGFWGSNSSSIAYTDLSNGTNGILATLPLTVKKISFINSDEMIFINQTDSYDRGKQISKYSIFEKKITDVVNAKDGYGIEDYVLSPDNKFLVVWELRPNQDFSLIGGKSRISVINLSQNSYSESEIYSEESAPGKPVHYPLGVSNNGLVMSDLFLPNDGVGWGYGWSKFDSQLMSGGKVAEMDNGTISTQPIITSGSDKFVFAGYDGSLGNGTTVNNGYRVAIANPNTLEVYDVLDDKRTKLSLTNLDRYSPIDFMNNGSVFVYKRVSRNSEENGYYLFDLSNMSSVKIPFEASSRTSSPAIIHILSKSTFIAGDQATELSNGANLGKKYGMTLNSIYLYDSLKKEKHQFPVMNNGTVQYITTVDSSFFPKNKSGVAISISQKELQLSTFKLKNELLKKRQSQQNPTTCGPTDYVNRPECNRCITLASQYCNNLLGTNFPATFYLDMPVLAPSIVPIPGAPTIDPKDIGPLYNKFAQCYVDMYIQASVLLCNNSPLYLYGTNGQKVNIVVGSPIFNSNASYSTNEGYAVTLGNSGKIFIGSQTFDSIDFDYRPGIKKIDPPQESIIMSKSEISEKMHEYAKNLGLNDNETRDLIKHLISIADKPYLAISHFNEEISKKILPLTFYPHPDNYYNIVFYIKKLSVKPSIVPSVTSYQKITDRNGLTAVEISYIEE